MTAYAQTSTRPDGNGGDVPYKIATLEHLYWLTQNPDQWSSSFVQMADIDALPTADWNNGKGFSPIGNSNTKFTGRYDGQGHKISDLFINRVSSDYIGFFGFVENAAIENLGLTKVNIRITDGSSVGGLVGVFYSGLIKRCFTTGKIEVFGTYIGGLIGSHWGGGELEESFSNTSLHNLLNHSNSYVGGLIGYFRGTVKNSYSTGYITYDEAQNNLVVGGLIAYRRGGSVINSYWNTDVSGQLKSDGGTGLNSSDMRKSESFESWDFSTTWDMEENNTFPFLRNNIPVSLSGFESFAGGEGSEINPFRVNSPYQLHQIRNYPDQHFIQIANIEMSTVSDWDSEKGFNPIGNSVTPFGGKYDGQEYLITDLKIDRISKNGVALFGYTSGILVNIGLINADISGHHEVGGVVGFIDLEGLVSHCYSTGRIHGNSSIGGVAGNVQSGLISHCYSESSISGVEALGGLAGTIGSLGAIEQSYSMGSVSGDSFSGGLLGVNEGGSVTNSYWNIERSGQHNSGGGIGLSDSEMKRQNSYSGWDFINTWQINDGYSFPYLRLFPTCSIDHVVAGEAGWRMFGSPFHYSTFETIVGNLWTQGYPESGDPSSEANLYTWNEKTTQWEVPVSQSAPLNTGQGFIMYVYEDDDITTPGIQGGFPKTIAHNDKIANILPLSIPLSYSVNETYSFDGFNLVANPTPSIVDWDQLNKTNVSNTYYVWDSANSEYDAYQTGVGGVNGGTRHIEPFRGYWVRAIEEKATLSIDSAAVVNFESKTPPVFSKERSYRTILLQLKDDAGKSDELRIVLREDAEAGLDEMDAIQLTPLTSSFLSLSSLADGHSLTIDSRPTQGTEPIVFNLLTLSMNTEGNRDYKLLLAEDQLMDWNIELKDSRTGNLFNLRDDAVDVDVTELQAKNRENFTEPKQMVESESNWQLILSPITTGIEDSYIQLPKELYLSQNYPNPFNPATTIDYELPIDGQVTLLISDLMGRHVLTLVNEYHKAGRYTVKFNAAHLASGIYLYSLRTPSGNLHRRMTIIK